MEEFHPLVVHFPIALTLTAVGLDLLGLVTKREHFHVAARWNFLFALVIGAAAFGTGLLAEDEVPSVGVKHEIAERHKLLAIGFMGLISILTIWRFRSGFAFPRKMRWLYTIGILAAAPLIGLTAHQGGTLVYEHGIGTALRYADRQEIVEPPAPAPAQPSTSGSTPEQKPPVTEEIPPIKTRPQNKCIVMPTEDIDPSISFTYKDVEYFFCCRRCLKKFQQDPERYLK